MVEEFQEMARAEGTGWGAGRKGHSRHLGAQGVLTAG